MKKFWKKASAKAGFTLVELVVVIAVLAILAAVAYPAYTGYIQRANDAKVISQVSNVLTAIKSAEAVAGMTNDIDTIKITKSGTDEAKMEVKFSGTVTDAQEAKILSAVGEFLDGAESGKATSGNTEYTWTLKKIDFAGTSYEETGIQWTGGEWDAAPTPTPGA